MRKVLEKVRKKGLFNSIKYIIFLVLYNVTKVFLIPIFNLQNIKNDYVLFLSRPDFSDNAKVYYDFLVQNRSRNNDKYIWLVEDKKRFEKCNLNNTKFVQRIYQTINKPTFGALYYAAISKEIYFTHMSPIDKLKVKDGQIVINLWHGCGYKDTEQQKKSYIQSNYFNYALVPGDVFIDTKSRFWGCRKEQILNIGYPRYDLFFEDNMNTEKYVSDLTKKNKLVIWMPTFRKTKGGNYPEEKMNQLFDLPILNSNKELSRLNDLCKDNNIVLCIKRHPMQLKYQCEDMKLSNIVFISNDDLVKADVNLYSLLKYTDGLITDYSSVAIDYLLLDKPIAFTLDDFENYKKSRGFVFENPKEYMPGNHIYNYDDIIEFIKQISCNQDLYAHKRKDVIKKVHNKCDNYCARIFDEVEKLKNVRK